MSWTDKLSSFRELYHFWRRLGMNYETACCFAREQLTEMAEEVSA